MRENLSIVFAGLNWIAAAIYGDGTIFVCLAWAMFSAVGRALSGDIVDAAVDHSWFIHAPFVIPPICCLAVAKGWTPGSE